MQNNIMEILLFAGSSLGIYYLIPAKARKFFLLGVSLFFYLLCDYRFAGLILLEVGGSYWLSLRMKRNSGKKMYFIMGVVLTAGILLMFKYYRFFIPSFCRLLNISEDTVVIKIVMPLGISYYSFKIISYLADVYRNKVRASADWSKYFLYIIFFPQIICGPISRYEEIEDALNCDKKFQPELFSEGILLIISGLYKKLVIADKVSAYVNTIFSNPESFNGLALLLASFLYSIQLYCDFSGYSEIAIGITNLFGIGCRANFDCPYFSTNIREFWRRWHISLSSWLRDYIYIPLGGGRCSRYRKWCNLMATFLISGIWHGNRLTFILWGAYHGLLNCLSGKGEEKKNGKWAKRLWTFILVTVGWTLFRMENVQEFIYFYTCLLNQMSISIADIQNAILPFTYDYSCLSYFLCVMLPIILLFTRENREVSGKLSSDAKWKWNILYIVLIALLGKISSSNFIYANF